MSRSCSLSSQEQRPRILYQTTLWSSHFALLINTSRRVKTKLTFRPRHKKHHVSRRWNHTLCHWLWPWHPRSRPCLRIRTVRLRNSTMTRSTFDIDTPSYPLRRPNAGVARCDSVPFPATSVLIDPTLPINRYIASIKRVRAHGSLFFIVLLFTLRGFRGKSDFLQVMVASCAVTFQHQEVLQAGCESLPFRLSPMVMLTEA